MTKAIYIIGTTVILIATLAASYGSLAYSPQWWPRVNETVTYNGRASHDAKVFLGRNELVLIDLRCEGDGLYVVNSRAQEIGMPNESNFFMAFGYAYSKELSPPLASIGKAEMPPTLRILPYEAEFTSMKGARVVVRWRLNL